MNNLNNLRPIFVNGWFVSDESPKPKYLVMLTRIKEALVVVAGINFLCGANSFAQCTAPCPADATDGPASILGLITYKVNPDGTTGSAIGNGTVAPSDKIRLKAALVYSTPGLSGGTCAAFSGGHLIIRTADDSFSQDVTPADGVPVIGPCPSCGFPDSCSVAVTNFFLSEYVEFDISQHQDQIVNGRIAFQAVYGPTGTKVYFCPPVLDILSAQISAEVKVTSSRLTVLGTDSGFFRLSLEAPPSNSYVIRTSSDLANWTALSTNVIPSKGILMISDPMTAGQPARFYVAEPYQK
jgi:hypothetical protein